MPAVWLLTIAIFAPLLAGVATLLLPRRAIATRTLLATAGMLLAFGLILHHSYHFGVPASPSQTLTSVAVQHHSDAGAAHDATHAAAPEADPAVGPDAAENPLQQTGVIPWMPSLHIEFAYLTDGLGVFFALLVSGIGVMICLYARGYFGPDEDDLYRFYPMLGFFATAMVGVALSDFMLLTLLFWELTSISSFLLIGWDRYDKKAVKLAMQAFFTTGLGGMGLFGGILLFGQSTDIWRWSTLLAHWQDISFTTPVVWAFVLMFIGAASKSAQWPFHYWLPGAMAAPTPVSAYLHSATMVKAGVFLVGRLFPVFSVLPIWSDMIIPLGGATMLLGAFLAINQHDLKRIFAYTTVSQLGLLTCMYGLGGLHLDSGGAMLDWDISQIANHAFYKAPLFIIAGAIGHVAATRDLPQLHGYWRSGRMAKCMVITMLVAGYALAAGPGTISFPAKELFIYSIYHAAEQVSPVFWVLMAATVLTAMFNVAIFIRLATTLLGSKHGMRDEAFFAEHGEYGPKHHDNHVAHPGTVPDEVGGHVGEEHHEHGPWHQLIWIPAALIVSLQIIGGLFPQVWEMLFRPLEVHFSYFHPASYTGGMPSIYGLHPGVPLYMSMLAIALGVAVGFSKFFRGVIVDIHDRLYPGVYWLCVTGGGYAFRLVQRGSLRFYIAVCLSVFLVMCVTALAPDATVWPRIQSVLPSAGESLVGLLLGVTFCIAAIGMPLTQQRVIRIMLLGICGFCVVGLYVIYQAPDLALTQLMVEIISVILFVLVLRLLPGEQPAKNRGRTWKIAIGAAAGLALGVMTLIAAPTLNSRDDRNTRYELLGEYFAENSYKGDEPDAYGEQRGGGGKNIVNVVLVDFRGFDTLGEITVLSLAGMGVWSLVTSRRKRTRDQEEGAPS